MGTESFNELFSNAWGIAMIVVFLGGSIFIHELGHFLAARKRGLKIERFSIGFGPKLFGWERNGVEYRVSLLPLGGYVSLPQLADMGMIEGETQSDRNKLPPISYTDKMIVAVMGAVFNILLALSIGLVLWIVGVPSTQQAQTTQVGYVPEQVLNAAGETVPGPAYEAGLKAGDIITHVDGRSVSNFSDILHFITASTGHDKDGKRKISLTIERDGESQKLTVEPVMLEMNPATGEERRSIGIELAYPLYVKGVFEDSPAHQAGLLPGDRILAVNDEKVYSIYSVIKTLQDRPGEAVSLTVQRAEEEIELDVTPQKFPVIKPLGIVEFAEDAKLEVVTLFDDPASVEQESPHAEGQLIVLEITGDFPGSEQLHFGNPIVEVNGTAVNSIETFTNAASTGKALKLGIGERQTAKVTPLQNTDDTAATTETAIAKQSESQRTISLPEPQAVAIQPAATQVMVGFRGQSPNQQRVILYRDPFSMVYDSLRMTTTVLGALLHPQSDIQVKNLSGPVSIGRMIHQASKISFRTLLWLTAFINVNLALLNLLPIPVLDGGHMLFATIAKLRGGRLPAQLVAGAQSVFMVLILGLMCYILFYDSLRWVGDNRVSEQVDYSEAQAAAKSIVMGRSQQ